MTPPGPDVKSLIESENQNGTLRPSALKAWLNRPVSRASSSLKVVEVILSGANIRSVMKSMYDIPEYNEMTCVANTYI